MATLLGKGDLIREGTTFLGWSLTKNELITSAAEEEAAGILGSTVTFTKDEDLTVYAVWAIDENGPEGEPDDTPDYLQYHLIYDGNGNTSGGKRRQTASCTTKMTWQPSLEKETL